MIASKENIEYFSYKVTIFRNMIGKRRIVQVFLSSVTFFSTLGLNAFFSSVTKDLLESKK